MTRIDSLIFNRNFYGIVNAAGEFWTPLGFASKKDAEAYIQTYWGVDELRARPKLRDKFKIVPVRIRLQTIPEASAIEAPSGVETTGSTEGESAVGEAETPKGNT